MLFIKDVSLYTKIYKVQHLEEVNNLDSPLVEVDIYDGDGTQEQTEEFRATLLAKGISYNELAYPTEPDVDGKVLAPLRTWNIPANSMAKLNAPQFPFVVITYWEILDGVGGGMFSEVYDTVAELQADTRVKPNVLP